MAHFQWRGILKVSRADTGPPWFRRLFSPHLVPLCLQADLLTLLELPVFQMLEKEVKVFAYISKRIVGWERVKPGSEG